MDGFWWVFLSGVLAAIPPSVWFGIRIGLERAKSNIQ